MQFFVTFSVPAPTHKYIYLFLLFFTFFIYLLRDEIEKMRLKFKSYFFKLSISILKSNYISWCKIMQNGKRCSFYTIWRKKTPTSIWVNLCINASCYFLSSIFLPLPSIATAANRSFFLCFSLFSSWMGLISGFRVECLLPSPSPSPPLAFGGVDLVSCSRHRHRRCWCKPSILFLILAIATGGVDLDNWVLIHFARFVFVVFCWWVVWIPVWYRCGLWVWVGGCVGKEISAGGLCGFRCDTSVNCGCGSVAVWVKKWIFYLNKCV